jgi:hypothetical protein
MDEISIAELASHPRAIETSIYVYALSRSVNFSLATINSPMTSIVIGCGSGFVSNWVYCVLFSRLISDRVKPLISVTLCVAAGIHHLVTLRSLLVRLLTGRLGRQEEKRVSRFS